MKDIRAMRGRYYIQDLVSMGEHVGQDFKFAVSDPRKIARSVSAFANNSGGHLLIGVKDNGVIAGVRDADEEIYVVEQAARRYCRPSQEVEFALFRVEHGVDVVRARIAPSEVHPVEVDEGRGKFRAYYRVADENIAAHPLMTEAWHFRDSGPALSLTFEPGSLAADILDALAERAMDVRQLAIALHASARAVRDTLVALSAARVTGFVFDGQAFVPAGADSPGAFTI